MQIDAVFTRELHLVDARTRPSQQHRRDTVTIRLRQRQVRGLRASESASGLRSTAMARPGLAIAEFAVNLDLHVQGYR